MTQPVSSEEHDNLFRATEEFKKYQENIVPETPLASEPITDIDGNQIGWYIQYEVMVVNNDSIVKNTVGLDELPEGLEEIAKIRLQYPEATLKELGDLLTVPLGKSGVNHRLRKLSNMAEKLRENKEENYD